MKKFIVYILLILFITGCGYQIAGYNTLYPVKFYINVVENETIDSNIGDVIQKTAERYFIQYGELASYKNATFFIDIKAYDLDYNTAIQSATQEAVSTEIKLTLDFIVTNTEGQEIFTKVYDLTESYAVDSRISKDILYNNAAKTLQNRYNAISTELNNILDNFRIYFNNKIYK